MEPVLLPVHRLSASIAGNANPDRIELPARPTDEPRFFLIGQIRQTLWTATVTYRHEETIRLISVRRARDSEKAQYLDAESPRH